MVEVARLESVYRFIAYPGFESPSLRQNKKTPRIYAGRFHIREKRACACLGFEGFGLQAKPRPAGCRRTPSLRQNKKTPRIYAGRFYIREVRMRAMPLS